MAIVAVSITPVGVGEADEGSERGTSVSRWVAAAMRVARDQDRVGVEHGSMFTTFEGELDEIFALVRRMQEAVFAEGAQRVGTVMKIDDRRDRATSMADKRRSIDRRLASNASE